VSKPIKSAKVKGPIGTFVPNFIVLSISSTDPIPSYNVKIAFNNYYNYNTSFIYGIKILFAINPGISLETEYSFCKLCTNLIKLFLI